MKVVALQKKRRSVSSLTSPRNGRNPRIGTGDIYGKRGAGGFGNQRVGGPDTQWPCNCTNASGGDDGMDDLSVQAGSVNQANRRCIKRGETQGRSCTSFYTGGGANNFRR